ncbi:MAG: autotransporter domain-containing protein [Chlamydiales bacterium]
MRRFTFVLLFSFFASQDILFSTTYTWNIDSNGNWNQNGNWDVANFPNGAGDTAIFGSAITADRTINISGIDITVGGITFNNANQYQIISSTNNTLSLATGALINAMNGTAFFNIQNINLNNGVLINANDGSSNGTVLFPALDQVATKTFTVARGHAPQDLIIQSSIAGDIVINGNGITQFGLNLSDFITVSSNFTINGGTVQFSGADITDGSNAATIIAPGVLKINFVEELDTIAGSGTIELNSELDLGLNNGSSTFSGNITGSSGPLVLIGSGTLTLNGTASNDFAGDIQIASNGTLQLSMGGGATAVPHNVVFTADNGTVSMGAANQFSSTSALNFAGTSLTTFNLNDNNQTIGSLSGTNTSTQILTGTGVGGILTINTSGSSSYAGKISQNGGLTIQGTGTFIFAAGLIFHNSYTGPTRIESGTLQAAAGNVLARGSPHTIAGGTLDFNGFNQQLSTLIFNSGTLTQGGALLTLTSGTNALTMQGNNTISGTLHVTSSSSSGNDIVYDNTQAGTATISGSLNLQIVGRTFNIPHNNSNLVDMVVSGGISESGGSVSVTKIGNGVLQFSGANTYTGGTTVSAGTLQGNTSSLPGNITNNALLVFDQAVDGTYSSALTGTGSLTKQNSGNLSFSGNNSIGGSTTVSAGRLSVNGPLTTSGVTVASGATLGGTGTINAPVTASGMLSPGNSIGTLNIVGNVVQGDNSTLQSEVDPTTSSLLNITGNYTIGSNATLFVTVDPGVYPASKSYNLVTTTSGTVSGQFATVTLSLPLFRAQVLYEPNDVVFTEISSVPFSEVVIGGNAGAVATCLDTLTAASGSDLELVLAELRMIPTVEELNVALALLQPSQYTALALAEENATLYTNGTIFERLRQITQACPQACKKIAKQPPSQPALAKKSKQVSPPTKEIPAAEKHFGFWLAPFGALSRQHDQGGQTGFNAGTGGIATGWDFHPSCHWTVGGALGYSYVHLKWREGQGHSNMNNGYGALYASAAGKYAYIFGSAMGSYNQYDTARHIDIDSDVLMLINRTAKGEHKGWQGSGHLQGGLLFGKKIQFSPFIEADYIYVHENGFNEHGAQSLNLQVAKKNSDLLQAEGGLEIARCFSVSTNSVSPSVGFSVIREWRFIGKNYTSNFIGSSCIMHTSGMKPDRTLYSPAAGLTLLLPDENRTLSFEYKGKFGEHFQDNRLLAQFVVKF